jgi:hypothetical protein
MIVTIVAALSTAMIATPVLRTEYDR